MRLLWICYFGIFCLILSKRIARSTTNFEVLSRRLYNKFYIQADYGVSRGLYDKITHNTDPKARCLDGTSPPVFLHQGSQPQNILLYLMGGGTCADGNVTQSLGACYKRSLTQFGSSNPWNATYSGAGQGILDTDSSKNKFAGWTKVIIIYCDGSFYQGNNVNPVPFNGTNLYFRGAVNMRSHISWANTKFNFNKANKVVLAGSSAGGTGVFLWIDYLKSQVSDPSKVYGVADSGIFMDPASGVQFRMQVYSLLPFEIPSFLPAGSSPAGSSPAPTNPSSTSVNNSCPWNCGVNSNLSPDIGGNSLTIDNVVAFMGKTNADERPPNKNCINTLTGNTSDWKCLFAGYASRYLESKLLWIESEYDQFVITNIIQLPCLTTGKGSAYTVKKCSTPDLLIIDFYRSIIMMQIYTQLQATGHSIWSIACSWHTALSQSTIYNSPSQRAPYTGHRLTAQDALVNFITKNQTVFSVDQYPWPSNRECAY